MHAALTLPSTGNAFVDRAPPMTGKCMAGLPKCVILGPTVSCDPDTGVE